MLLAPLLVHLSPRLSALSQTREVCGANTTGYSKLGEESLKK
uniref:Uncharacterized protein n=1 Tax=Anguilla anguilla TaxID=7936 RepID=A0A0E9RJ98_ANGAN